MVYPTEANGNRIGEYQSDGKYSSINNNDGNLLNTSNEYNFKSFATHKRLLVFI